MQKNKQLNTKTLVSTALLVTISIVLAQFVVYIPLFGFPSVRFSVSSIPIILTGVLFGGVFGAIAGFLSDIISFLLANAGAPYHPGFTINMILTGLIPGIIFTVLRTKKIEFSFGKINSVISVLALVGAVLYINLVGVHKVENLGSIMGIPMNIVLSFVLTLLVIGLNVIVYKLQKRYGEKEGIYSIDKLIFSGIVVYLIVQLTCTPIWMLQLYNIPIPASIFVRVFKCLIDVPLQVTLVYLVLKAMPMKIKGRVAYE